MIGKLWLCRKALYLLGTPLLVVGLAFLVAGSGDATVGLVWAHSGSEVTGSWVSISPRGIHVDDVGTAAVSVDGGGFTAESTVTVYMVDAEAATSGCPLMPLDPVLVVTATSDSGGGLSLVPDLLGTEFDVGGRWALCAKEDRTLARGDIFSVVTGSMLSMTSDSPVGLGDTFSVSGRGFSSGETVRVFAVSSGPAEDDCGEACLVYVCPAFDVDTHDLAETGVSDVQGKFTGVGFDLSRGGFGKHLQWGFCAVGGSGEATVHPLHLHLAERWGAGDDWVLTSGVEEVFWISPPLTDRRVELLSVGGLSMAPLSESVTMGGWSEIRFVADVLPGNYTMAVEFSGGGAGLVHSVRVVDPALEDDRWVLELSVNSLPSGGELTVTGEAPEGTAEVTLYGVAPSEIGSLLECPGPRGYPVLGVAPVKGNDTFIVEVSTGHDVMDEAGRWAVCATDGEDSRSKELLWVEIELNFLVLAGVLYSDHANAIALVPELAPGVMVSKVLLDGEELVGDHELRSEDGLSVFDIEIDADGGGYVLLVELSDGTRLAGLVRVSPTGFGALDLELSPSTVSVGDVVAFTGERYAAGLTVKVFVVAPSLVPSGGKCPAASEYEALVLVDADDAGEIEGEFVVDGDKFDELGVWWVCAIDGGGGEVELPAELTVDPGLVFPVKRVVRFVEYDVEFHPGLAADAVIESVSFGGQDVPGPWGFDTSGDFPFFVFSTERDAGKYTLRVLLSDDVVAEMVVNVVDSAHEPVLAVPGRLDYGTMGNLVVSGYRANGPVGLVAVRLTEDNSELTCEEVAELDEEELDYIWVPSEEDGDLSDDSGNLVIDIEIVVDNFDTPGSWLFCVLDRPARISAVGVEVVLAPNIEVGVGGRVQVGDEVRIVVEPPLDSDADVDYLKLENSDIEYMVSNGEIVWTEVPRKVGTFQLTAEIHGVEVYAVVTVLSGVPPGLEVKEDALECPGLTEFRDPPGPGVETSVTLRFLLDADGTLLCYVSGLVSLPTVGTLVGLESTTVLPERELVVEFPPEYTLPMEPRVSILVGSFDNEFGHRFVPRGVQVFKSDRDDRNHRVIIPGCVTWVDNRGDPAPCEIELAKDITVLLQGRVKLPTDASGMYPTQVVYGESAIWDLVEFGASILVNEDEITYGDSITLEGDGFPGDEKLRVYGVNTSLMEPELPEGQTSWTCEVMGQHGKLLAEVPRRGKGKFEASVDTGIGLGIFPGRWDVCVVSEGGLSANEPDSVVVNYLLHPQSGDVYESGSVGYVRVEPGLPDEVTDVTLTVDGGVVESEIISGNEVHFTAPSGMSGSVLISAGFNDGLESSLDASFNELVLGLRVAEAGDLVRIGSMLELSVERLSGDAVCDVELAGVKLHLIDDGTLVDGCAVVGANRKWEVRVLVLGEDGEVTAELVDLFEVGGTVELKAVSTDDEEITGSVELLRPWVNVTDDGEPIKGNFLMQFRPVLVSGYDFPKENANFGGVEVGYEVRDELTWESHTRDGAWSSEFRVRGRTEVGRRLEFVPLIGGHRMESLAFVLTVGVGTPVVLVDPSVVETGLEVTVRASNLLGFVGGYRFVIREEDGSGNFRLLDGVTKKVVELVTDGDGNAEKTFVFPDYEAFYYDAQGRASVEFQLLNSAGEEVPEAVARVTHVKPEPVVPAPTEVPDDSALVEEVLVERVPFPVTSPEVVSPLSGAFLPKPTPWGLESHGQDLVPEGAPDGVDHSRVLVESGANGTTITLTWVEPLGEFAAEGYLISRALTRGGKALPVAVAHHGRLPLYVDLDVLPDRSYWYYIISHNDYGLAKSEGIDPVRVRTVGAPTIVERFEMVSDDGDNYVFEWDPPVSDPELNAPVNGYLLEAKAAEGGEWVVVSRPTGSVRSVVLKKYGGISLVRYRIAAANGVGGSPWQEWQRPLPVTPVLVGEDDGGFPWLLVIVALVVGAGALGGGWFGLNWWSGRPDRFAEKPLRSYDAGTWMTDPVEVPPHLVELETESEEMDDADDGEEVPYAGRLTDSVGDDEDVDDGGVVGDGGGSPPSDGDGGGQVSDVPGDTAEPGSRGAGAPGELRRSVFVYPDPSDGSLGGGTPAGG